MLKKIASFTINHDILTPGLYLSRVDGNDMTYDLRLKTPNQGDYLENGALHTLEHLIATYLRSSRFSDEVVYFGPMGCRTGFYMILRDTGNYLEHDLAGAKKEAAAYVKVLTLWQPEDLTYPTEADGN